ncbi:MAG TPA: NAD-dependent deacylase [Anaerolineales bacterium]|nr:NAD-dependent deacylase [Anaerolineales bacterium]
MGSRQSLEKASGCEVSRAADLIRSLKQVTVLTGAGISTPSGIPDFRSPGSGLWSLYDPMEVATLSVFRYHPEKFFAWMQPLAAEMVQARPNPAHYALARLEQSGYVLNIITQNIDGLHQRAGSKNVLEVHGSLETLTCIDCYQQFPSSGLIEPYVTLGQIPLCPDCKAILKPNAVLFEEQLPVRTWLSAQQACRNCRVMLVAGSSLEVMPAAGLPLQALERDARLILINDTPTYLDERADVILRGDLAEVLPEVAAEVLRETVD